jgi:hypothetical protein
MKNPWLVLLLSVGAGAGLGSLFWWNKAKASSSAAKSLPSSRYSAFVSLHPDDQTGKPIQIFTDPSLKSAFTALLQTTVSEGFLEGFPMAILNSPAGGRTLEDWLQQNIYQPTPAKFGDVLPLLSTNSFIPSAAEIKSIVAVPKLRSDVIDRLAAPGARYGVIS